MDQASPMALAPKLLMKYLVQMEPPLSPDTARKIIQHLRGVSIAERDRRAETLLKMLKQGATEPEILKILEQ